MVIRPRSRREPQDRRAEVPTSVLLHRLVCRMQKSCLRRVRRDSLQRNQCRSDTLMDIDPVLIRTLIAWCDNCAVAVSNYLMSAIGSENITLEELRRDRHAAMRSDACAPRRTRLV